MDRIDDAPDDGEYLSKKIDELNRRGFQVHLTRHCGNRSQIRFYCRIRGGTTDLTFFGLTSEIAIAKALESLGPSETAT
jgi:hypothetical protein